MISSFYYDTEINIIMGGEIKNTNSDIKNLSH